MGYNHTGDPHEVDGFIAENTFLVEVEHQEESNEHQEEDDEPQEANIEHDTSGHFDPNTKENPQEVDQTEDLRNYSLERDRLRRNTHPPLRFGHADLVSYAFIFAENLEYQKPKSYIEAINSSKSEKWMMTMIEELQSLEINNTWTLVDKPELKVDFQEKIGGGKFWF